ncbi:MAG: CPBP family intramembrane metalloprotease [Opitutales bacterium]|nr:CPBP family intramembrane metalloprotease [Opitutales bacterium]
MNDPFGNIFYFVLTLWLASIWWRDIRSGAKGGQPGATACKSLAPYLIAVAGTLLLLAAETVGELCLGIADQQTDVSAIALLAFVSGAIVEELVFRAYLVVETRGETLKWLSIVVFSVVFALLHPYFWTFENPPDADALSIWERALAGTQFHFTLKAAWTTAFIFAGSLWFYFVRFFRFNPAHSILVPIAAHLAKNLAVFFIKLAEGHVTSWF